MEEAIKDIHWETTKKVLSEVCRHPDDSPHPGLLKKLCRIAYLRARRLNRNLKKYGIATGEGVLSENGILLPEKDGTPKVVLAPVEFDVVLTKAKITEQESSISLDDWSQTIKVLRAICVNPIISEKVDTLKGEISKIAKMAKRDIAVKEYKSFTNTEREKMLMENSKTVHVDELPPINVGGNEKKSPSSSPSESQSLKPTPEPQKKKGFWSRLFGN